MVVISGLLSNKDISNGVLQKFVLGLTLLNIFINNLDARIENTFPKCVGDSKLGEIAINLEDRMRSQNDFDRYEVNKIN